MKLYKPMPNGKTDLNNFGAVRTDHIGANHGWPEIDNVESLIPGTTNKPCQAAFRACRACACPLRTFQLAFVLFRFRYQLIEYVVPQNAVMGKRYFV